MTKNNKLTQAEYQKQYHEKNKDKLTEYATTLIECECGLQVTNRHHSRHKKSAKHNQIMDIINKNKSNRKK
jgi:hypothetical protein